MQPLSPVEITNFIKASILCAIDFSEGSRNALKSAIYMAEQNKTPLTVLYPYRLNQVERQTDVSQLRKSMDLEASKSFTELTQNYLRTNNITCDFRAEVGFLQDRIQAFVQRNRTGLVVVSKQLAIANKDGLDEILDKLQIPLMIVPQNENVKDQVPTIKPFQKNAL